MQEVWKDIKGYEGKYQVSNIGNIKSLNFHRGKQEKILKPSMQKIGYLRIVFCKNGKCQTYSVHRLVADAFIDNPNKYKEINHKDENKTNNSVDNLEWCDHRYNVNYGSRNKKVGNKKRAVLQYDKHGNFIKKWDSITDAYLSLKGKRPNKICDCCNGRCKSAHGFIWKYAEVV